MIALIPRVGFPVWILIIAGLIAFAVIGFRIPRLKDWLGLVMTIVVIGMIAALVIEFGEGLLAEGEGSAAPNVQVHQMDQTVRLEEGWQNMPPLEWHGSISTGQRKVIPLPLGLGYTTEQHGVFRIDIQGNLDALDCRLKFVRGLDWYPMKGQYENFQKEFTVTQWCSHVELSLQPGAFRLPERCDVVARIEPGKDSRVRRTWWCYAPLRQDESGNLAGEAKITPELPAFGAYRVCVQAVKAIRWDLIPPEWEPLDKLPERVMLVTGRGSAMRPTDPRGGIPWRSHALKNPHVFEVSTAEMPAIQGSRLLLLNDNLVPTIFFFTIVFDDK